MLQMIFYTVSVIELCILIHKVMCITINKIATTINLKILICLLYCHKFFAINNK